MKILCTDLDNTIIYSYRHDIGLEKRNVEIYKGREISFITNKTHELLKKVQKEYLVVPTTTRTIEEYKKIDLEIGDIKYALTCNGGILLINGERDNDWYMESKRLINDSIADICMAIEYLREDKRRKFDLRFIEELFVFTKCSNPIDVVNELKEKLNTNKVEVFNNREKVYVVPVNLSKGIAIKRLRKRLESDVIIAAGDSEFDISMVEEADKGIVPFGFKKRYSVSSDILEMPREIPFSESLLEECLKMSHFIIDVK